MNSYPQIASADTEVPLASLRPVLEYGWPAGAGWRPGDGPDAAKTVLEQPLGRAVAFRLRVDGGWRIRAEAGLPDGAAPALAWARVGLREPGGAETAIWWGVLARAVTTHSRGIDVELGGAQGEVDLVLRAGGVGVDRVLWADPVLHGEEIP